MRREKNKSADMVYKFGQTIVNIVSRMLLMTTDAAIAFA